MDYTYIFPDRPLTPTWREDFDSNRSLTTLFIVIISIASIIGFILLCTTVWCVIRKVRRHKNGPRPVFGNTWIVTQPPNLPYGQPQTAVVGQPWTTVVGQPWTAPAGQPWVTPVGQPWTTTTEQSRAIAADQSQITPANQPQAAPVDQPRTTSATPQM